MNRFVCPTRIVTGKDALNALTELSVRRLLVVTDPYFMENGLAQRVAQLVQAEQREYFDQVQPDPSVELVARGAARVRQLQPDTVVALGGGSAMDCAKAMVYFGGKDISLVAIPTTSGSGSEVTDFAVVTQGSVKHPLVDPLLQPAMAIVDESLVEKLPPSLVADGGFDVLSHALEALVATGGSAFSRALATDAFCETFAHLGPSYRGDLNARGRVHQAATVAGLAFSQAGLGLCHGLSHSLGGAFHIPHGRLNAILLPAVVGCNRTAGEQYAQVARLVGLGGSAEAVGVRNLKNGLIRLRRSLDLPGTLQEAGVDPAQVRRQADGLVAAAIKDPCCATNPVPVTADLVHRLLEEVTGRG